MDGYSEFLSLHLNKSNVWWKSILFGIIVLALTVYMFVKIYRPFQQRGKLAEGILKKVMSGELKSEESIRKAWLDGQNSNFVIAFREAGVIHPIKCYLFL